MPPYGRLRVVYVCVREAASGYPLRPLRFSATRHVQRPGGQYDAEEHVLTLSVKSGSVQIVHEPTTSCAVDNVLILRSKLRNGRVTMHRLRVINN